ncbi:peptidoglycan-binding protein [Maricaulis sp. CAU 1757]
MLPVNADTLHAIAPRFSGDKARRQAEIINAVGATLRATLADYRIDTPLRIAHFLAQLAHESAGFRTTEEFASGAAYEGRADLGNSEPGDGKRYKGRGLIQLTGRANYRALGKKLGIDLEGEPERAAEPALSLIIAAEYWTSRNINDKADRDDLVAVTRAINGGTNGLEDRRNYLGKAKTELARLGGILIEADNPPGARAVLKRGDKGPAVAYLQECLRKAGFPVVIDGDFGPSTELAVRLFQSRETLQADAIVGPATWAKLPKAG